MSEGRKLRMVEREIRFLPLEGQNQGVVDIRIGKSEGRLKW